MCFGIKAQGRYTHVQKYRTTGVQVSLYQYNSTTTLRTLEARYVDKTPVRDQSLTRHVETMQGKEEKGRIRRMMDAGTAPSQP